jgi:hypothetical protein
MQEEFEDIKGVNKNPYIEEEQTTQGTFIILKKQFSYNINIINTIP